MPSFEGCCEVRIWFCSNAILYVEVCGDYFRGGLHLDSQRQTQQCSDADHSAAWTTHCCSRRTKDSRETTLLVCTALDVSMPLQIAKLIEVVSSDRVTAKPSCRAGWQWVPQNNFDEGCRLHLIRQSMRDTLSVCKLIGVGGSLREREREKESVKSLRRRN